MQLSRQFVCPESGVVEDARTALCMLLTHLVHPSRLKDITMQFGWEISRFSRISRLTALFLWNRWKHLLRFDPQRLSPQKLQEFARIIHAKGAPLTVVSAFVDGTLRKNARPSYNQRILYNGWKRISCLKYHLLLSPDGIVIHIYGPVEGRHHDDTVYKQSGLEDLLNRHFHSPDGSPLFIYGDPAYSVSGHVMTPYKGAAIPADQRRFNSQMSKVREAVEWSFKEVTQQFPFLDLSRNQKILKSPCALFYLVAVLLCNAHTCLHRPQIPQFFNCFPPTLDEYFTGGPVDDAELDEWCLQAPWADVDIPPEDVHLD